MVPEIGRRRSQRRRIPAGHHQRHSGFLEDRGRSAGAGGIPFGLREVMDGVADIVGLNAQAKGLALLLDMPRELPTLVGDPSRLRQVLLNLGQNAVKFTERGEVNLTVRVLRQDAATARMRFEVEDSGIGMSREMQLRLFRPFTQGDASINRRYGGTGLGLSISQRLVRMIGGDIDVHSVPGQGSRLGFELQFPLQGQAQEMPGACAGRPVASARCTPAVGGRQPHQPGNRRVVAGQRWRFGRGRLQRPEGTRAARTLRFDCVLMDCEMAVLDGYEATRRLRQRPHLRELPVIAMTANALVGDREKALTAGMNDHIAKPIDVDKMHATLALWVCVAAPRARVTCDEGRTTVRAGSPACPASPAGSSTR
jgi:CheY-like chemotaxis protein